MGNRKRPRDDAVCHRHTAKIRVSPQGRPRIPRAAGTTPAGLAPANSGGAKPRAKLALSLSRASSTRQETCEKLHTHAAATTTNTVRAGKLLSATNKNRRAHFLDTGPPRLTGEKSTRCRRVLVTWADEGRAMGGWESRSETIKMSQLARGTYASVV